MPYRRRRKKPKKEVKPTSPPKTYQLILVPPQDVAEFWPLVADFVASGLVTGDDSIELLYDQCLTGEFQLWIVWGGEVKAAGVTSLVMTRHGLHLQAESFGGDGMAEWFDTQDTLYDWAKRQGCYEVRFMCRPGWSRPLKAKGFEMTHILLRKRLV